jgi:hypothetical protein
MQASSCYVDDADAPSERFHGTSRNKWRAMVPQAAEAGDGHGLDQAIARDHPHQVGDIAGRQRVETNAPEDRRQAMITINPSSCDINCPAFVFAMTSRLGSGDHGLCAETLRQGATMDGCRSLPGLNPLERAFTSCPVRASWLWPSDPMPALELSPNEWCTTL